MANRRYKQLLNSVETCVDEMLEGVVAVNPAVKLLKGHRVVLRTDIREYQQAGKVAVLSGGGSGHEPFAAGFVGRGLLTGSIAGSVFTSPPASEILAAINAVANPAGVLLIVANYTGDRINFGIAAEKAMAQGIRVKTVTVAEDCALTSADKTAGKRGLCGIILIQKIAGAMAEDGQPLDNIVEFATRAATQMGTIGISLFPCHVPGSGSTFQIADDDMELGLGVHGEPGVKRIKVCEVDALTTLMIDHMTNTATGNHIQLESGNSVMVVLNDLGGTSLLELFVVARSVVRHLESKHVVVERIMVGHFMTSLDMAGLSLTIMHLDEQKKRFFDSETNALAWQRYNVNSNADAISRPRGSSFIEPKETSDPVTETMSHQSGEPTESWTSLVRIVRGICESLINSEDILNHLDRSGGDGDCGSTMRRGAEAILNSAALTVVMGAGRLLNTIASSVEQSMGGSSGGLYSLFLTAAAAGLLESNPTGEQWLDALQAGIEAVSRYGGAEPGDRTMLDPLHAIWTSLHQSLDQSEPLCRSHFQQAVQAADASAEQTGSMPARAGRASYVNPDLVKGPDPGAQAVAIWFRAAFEAYYH